MMNILPWWPAITTAALALIWFVRLEGVVQRNNEKEDQRYGEIMRLLAEHYATKIEISTLKGAIDTLSPQLADTKASVLRIENKVDAFLVAALQHLPGADPRRG